MSNSDLKENAQKPLHGMDYGVPPRYALLANPALMELWNQAKCIGLGYLKFPNFDSFVDVPGVCIMFEDAEKGARIFKLLQSWDCDPKSGRGTDISFIEDRVANSYTLSIGPNMNEMIRRLLDPSKQEDYSLTVMGLTVGRTMDLSERFHWLRNQPRSKPIVFIPGDNSRIAPKGYAVIKSDVKFYDKEKIPKDTIEHTLLSGEVASHDQKEIKPSPIDPIDIRTKRERRLKRFFPVAMARLEYNRTFLRIVERLEVKYERWQIVQAACNILCRERFPSLQSDNGKIDFHKAYDALRNKAENVSDEMPLNNNFSIEQMDAQIADDVCYLFDQLRPSLTGDDPVVALRMAGVLR